jgi:multicomponent Na+:H+ antiporter subunit C
VSVSLVLVVLMAIFYSVGVYLLLERSMTRVLLGFMLVGNATNLLILVISGRSGTAPFFGDAPVTEMSDPLPQAFVLTSIVITFGVSAFLMALIYRSWRLANADVVQDDIEDVEVGRRRVSVTSESAAEAEDTEFGTRAAAAVSTALDLEEAERLEEEQVQREARERDARDRELRAEDGHATELQEGDKL